ncbi:hypothetical protein BJV78DRAFT_1247407, partial [Lactifluus subvellereus]
RGRDTRAAAIDASSCEEPGGCVSCAAPDGSTMAERFCHGHSGTSVPCAMAAGACAQPRGHAD